MGWYNHIYVGPATPHRLDGITCDAKNCIHHDGDNYCTASHITVGNIIALTASETRCATFEPRVGVTKK